MLNRALNRIVFAEKQLQLPGIDRSLHGVLFGSSSLYSSELGSHAICVQDQSLHLLSQELGPSTGLEAYGSIAMPHSILIAAVRASLRTCAERLTAVEKRRPVAGGVSTSDRKPNSCQVGALRDCLSSNGDKHSDLAVHGEFRKDTLLEFLQFL